MIAKLDSAPLGMAVRIARIDRDILSHDEGRRLREFGLMEGVEVKPLHRGSLFLSEPLALGTGRMKVIIRGRQAAAIAVEAVEDGTSAAQGKNSSVRAHIGGRASNKKKNKNDNNTP